MAIVKKSFLGAATLAVVLSLAVCTPAGAVTLRDAIAGKGRPSAAFTEISLATASKAELQSALEAEIQAAMAQEMANAIAQELVSSGDMLEAVKGVANDALGEFMGSMKASMGDTCKRFAEMAQSKMDSMDSKLGQVAGEEGMSASPGGGNDDLTAPSEYGNSYGDAYTTNDYSTPYSAGPYETGAGPYDSTDGRVAWLQVELRNKHKGFFDRIKGFARKSFGKLKKFGGVVKGAVKSGLSSVWSAVKPALVTGVRSVVGKLKAQIPNLIGQACNAAENKLENVESRLIGPTEA